MKAFAGSHARNSCPEYSNAWKSNIRYQSTPKQYTKVHRVCFFTMPHLGTSLVQSVPELDDFARQVFEVLAVEDM